MNYDVVIQEMVEQVKLIEAQFKKATEQIEQCKITQRHIEELVSQISHVGLIPINDYGFMHGKVKHTNELLVHIGDDYFVETSAANAIAILDRRIKSLQEDKVKLQEQNIDCRLKIKQAMIEQRETEEIDIVEPFEDEVEENANGITNHTVKKDNNIGGYNPRGEVKEVKESKEEVIAFIPMVKEHTENKEEVQEAPKKVSKFMQQFHKK